MSMMKVLRVVDLLAERLIFDVLLATPGRRRAALVLFGGAALLAYGLSGLVWSPGALPNAETFSCQPYFDDTRWMNTGWEAGRLLADRPAPADVVATVRAQLAAKNDLLDRTALLALASQAPSFAKTPLYRHTRNVAHGLAARGVLRAADGRGDAAVTDWLAVARLGRILARGPAGRPATVLDGMIGCAVQNDATRQLVRHLDQGRMTASQAARVLADHARWDTEGYSLESLLAGERAAAVHLLDRMVTEGRYPSGLESLDLVTPLSDPERKAFFGEVRANVLACFDRWSANVRGDRATGDLGHPHCVCFSSKDPLFGAAAHTLPALVMRSAAINHVSAALIEWCLPRVEAFAERLRDRAAQREMLASRCREMMDRIGSSGNP